MQGLKVLAISGAGPRLVTIWRDDSGFSYAFPRLLGDACGRMTVSEVGRPVRTIDHSRVGVRADSDRTLSQPFATCPDGCPGL